MKQRTFSDQDIVCQIKTRGQLDQSWLTCFEGLDLDYDGKIAIVSGVFADQAILRGLLNRLWDLNLTILSVTQEDSLHHGEGETDNE